MPELYSNENVSKYNMDVENKLPPHIYSIGELYLNDVEEETKTFDLHLFMNISANEAMKEIQVLKKSQSIILMGETGRGKTESTKKLLDYICSFSKNDIAERINQGIPVLEAFGNAKTKWNDNSSRYCKFVQVC